MVKEDQWLAESMALDEGHSSMVMGREKQEPGGSAPADGFLGLDGGPVPHTLAEYSSPGVLRWMSCRGCKQTCLSGLAGKRGRERYSPTAHFTQRRVPTPPLSPRQPVMQRRAGQELAVGGGVPLAPSGPELLQTVLN